MGKRRWILVSDGTTQTMYAGKTDLEEEELDKRMSEHRPIELFDCRAMRTLIMPGQQPGAFTQTEMLSPISISRTGMRMKVRVMSYFWPDENDATNKLFMDKVRQVEKAEAAHRASEVGLVTVDALPSGGKLLS